MMVCLVGFDYDVVDVVLLQSALGYGCFSALLWIFLDDGKIDGAGWFASWQGSGGWRKVAAVCVGVPALLVSCWCGSFVW